MLCPRLYGNQCCGRPKPKDTQDKKANDVGRASRTVFHRNFKSRAPPYELSADTYLLIRRWRKALENSDDIFIQSPSPTNLEEMAIANSLSTLFLFDKESVRKTGKAVRHTHMQSETDFIVKYASVMLQNIFAASKKISIDWDILSFAAKERVPATFKTDRPDVVIICCSGIEVGCGEVKPPGKGNGLINKDRARIAEICKRQLHLRLKNATFGRELVTFGILLAGITLELTVLKFENGSYRYSILKTIELPKRKNVYDNIETCFEVLCSFKSLIEESLAEESEESLETIYDKYADIIKPTARFLK
ncbi:hypothetical protein G6F62_010702 [Rhizopus arrhizus]|nr:hypothetical protein G6F62_010702 [Rhizopus arrhizus]